MSKIRVDITRNYECSAETLFDFLSEHESLGALFAPFARFTRLNDGRASRNDVGSVRKISVMGVSSFLETYTRAEKPSRLEYVVSKSPLIKNHQSIMEITSNGSGSTLRYTSAFDGTLPLAAFFIGNGLGLMMQYAFNKLPAALPCMRDRAA